MLEEKIDPNKSGCVSKAVVGMCRKLEPWIQKVFWYCTHTLLVASIIWNFQCSGTPPKIGYHRNLSNAKLVIKAKSEQSHHLNFETTEISNQETPKISRHWNYVHLQYFTSRQTQLPWLTIFRARMAKMVSTAPAAPRRWPIAPAATKRHLVDTMTHMKQGQMMQFDASIPWTLHHCSTIR